LIGKFRLIEGCSAIKGAALSRIGLNQAFPCFLEGFEHLCKLSSGARWVEETKA